MYRSIKSVTASVFACAMLLIVFSCTSPSSDQNSDDNLAASPDSGVTDNEKADNGQQVADDAAGTAESSAEADDLNSAGINDTAKAQENNSPTNVANATNMGNAGNSANVGGNESTAMANGDVQNNLAGSNMNNATKADEQQAVAVNSVPTPPPEGQPARTDAGEAVNNAVSSATPATGPQTQQAAQAAPQTTAAEEKSNTAAKEPNAPKLRSARDEILEDQERVANVHYDEETHAAPADLYPVNALVYWVGYDYRTEARKLVVRILTHGNPQFSILQQQNTAQQPEIAIRFMQASLRSKIARDINATEFLSPVAYIRMREDPSEENVDVILTFREQANPRVFAKDGNVQLTFDLPEHYFAPKNEKKQAAIAVDLSSVVINPTYEQGSDMPTTTVAKADRPEQKPYVPDPGAREFKAAPADGGVPASSIIQAPGAAPNEGEAPPDFVAPSSNSAAPAPAGPPQGAMNQAVPLPAQNGQNDPQQLLPEEIFVIHSFDIGAVGQFSEGDFHDDPGASDVPPINSGEGGMGMVTQNPSGPTASTQPAKAVPNEITGTDLEGAASTQYSGKPILLDFHNAELYLVLQAITSESGYNFVFPESVGTTKITLRLLNVPWDEALKAILETQGLTMVPIGQNVMRIDTIDNITNFLKSKEQAEIFKQHQIETKVLVMRLSNAKATAVADELSKVLADAMGKDTRIRISFDERTNSVMVEGPEHVLAKVKAVCERMDLETPQVEIESRIVEVDRTMDSIFGVSWESMVKYDPGRGLGFGSLVFPNSVSSNFSVDPAVSTMKTSAGSTSVKFGSLNKILDLDLMLKMEEQRGVVNILQTNKLIVLDREQAEILAGSSQYFYSVGGKLAQVDFNLSMSVTPEITASGLVNMKVAIKSDTPNAVAGEVLANKNSREINTKMALKSGETAVIGGVYDTKTLHAVLGIPLLMDIPILGFLFRKTENKEVQMELLIMLTPRILSKTENNAPAATVDRHPVGGQSEGGQNGNVNSTNNSQKQKAPSGPVAIKTVGEKENHGGQPAGPDVRNNSAGGENSPNTAVEGAGGGSNDSSEAPSGDDAGGGGDDGEQAASGNAV